MGNKPSSDFMDSLFGGDSIGKKNDDATSTGQRRKNVQILNEILNASYIIFSAGGKKEFSLDEKYMKPAETKATPPTAKRPDPLDFGGTGKRFAFVL